MLGVVGSNLLYRVCKHSMGHSTVAERLSPSLSLNAYHGSELGEWASEYMHVLHSLFSS